MFNSDFKKEFDIGSLGYFSFFLLLLVKLIKNFFLIFKISGNYIYFIIKKFIFLICIYDFVIYVVYYIFL